jgi:hypothetical protein
MSDHPVKSRKSHYTPDPFSPTVASIISNNAKSVTTVYTFHNKPKQRYCEHCKSHQPINDQPYIKGWKCDNCLSEEPTCTHIKSSLVKDEHC